MSVQWVLVCHGLATLLVVISFLCGQWPIFKGTPIERIHYFISFGAYDYFLRFVGVVLGDKGTNAVLSVEYYCCDRPNPILQIIYLAIIGATYYFIAKSCFSYLSGFHRYTSLLAVGVGVLLFLLTSFSDPGTVKAENVSQYLSAYPCDNIIYTEKECSTCKLPKPARSKHCSICDRCVARFDHHCGWMNNCIGERNTRYFLAFLLWHFLLCVYGTLVIGLVLVGRLKELNVIYILTVYYGIENSFRSLAPHVVQVSFNGGIGSLVLDTIGHTFSKKYHNRVIQHEAGHFLIAYLVGILPRGYTLSSLEALQKEGSLNVQAGTAFVDFEFLEEVNAGKVSATTLNRFSCIALAGVASEYLLFGYAEGGLDDINKLDILLKSLGFTQKKADSQVRWSVLNIILLLRRHEQARAKLAEAMSKGKSVGSCIELIEDTIDDADI